MTRGIRVALALAVALGSTSLSAQDDADSGRGEKVDGYAEFRLGDCIVADAQRVCPGPKLRFKGEGEAKSFASVPLGYEIKAKGKRRADGTLLAREVEARPNGSALFEGEIKSATDQAEAQARNRGGFVESDGGKERNIGRLYEEGPQVERVRRIVDSLLPPYLHPEDVRIYVIENKEWNAFAMGNYSIYVFTGLLDDMDDDEVAIVLGHELVHATHEHSRKQFKKDMWIQLLALGALGAASTIDDDTKQAIVGLVVVAGASAWQQGLRAGHGGPGRPGGAALRLRGGLRRHEGAAAVEPLREEVRRGEQGRELLLLRPLAVRGARDEARAGDRPQLPRRAQARRPGPAGAARSDCGPSHGGDRAGAGSRRLAGAHRRRVAAPPSGAPGGAKAAADAETKRAEIKAGMTTEEVREALGDPDAEVAFGGKTQWTYPDLTIVFANGKVTDVKF